MRLNKRKLVFFFLIFYSMDIFCDSIFNIIPNEKENKIFVTMNNQKIEDAVYIFNFIPENKDLYVKYQNGSLLGYFPKINSSLRIIAWNDKEYIFELFFCDSTTGKISILTEGSGWDFHVFDSAIIDSKWVAIVPQGQASLFLIDSKGNISHKIQFFVDISPDIVTVEQRDNDDILILESLDSYCEYKLDFMNKSARIIKNHK
jgi:hypothetical protein